MVAQSHRDAAGTPARFGLFDHADVRAVEVGGGDLDCAWPASTARTRRPPRAATITIAPTLECAPKRSAIAQATPPRIPAPGIVSTQADNHLADHVPVHAVGALAEPGAEHAAGHDLRRRQRVAVVGRGEDHRGARRLGGEPLRRLDVRDPVAHRVDDPPAAAGGAERDRERAAELDPERDGEVDRADVAVGDQRERDHAHRLLGVVRPVGERDQRRGADLAVAVAGSRLLLAEPADQSVGEVRRRARRRHRR